MSLCYPRKTPCVAAGILKMRVKQNFNFARFSFIRQTSYKLAIIQNKVQTKAKQLCYKEMECEVLNSENYKCFMCLPNFVHSMLYIIV